MRGGGGFTAPNPLFFHSNFVTALSVALSHPLSLSLAVLGGDSNSMRAGRTLSAHYCSEAPWELDWASVQDVNESQTRAELCGSGLRERQ